jgi:uncharacterized protein (TIGR03435 family)
MKATISILLFSTVLQAEPRFEVTSVHVHRPGVLSRPTVINAKRAEFFGHSLRRMITYGYGVKPYEVDGPAWLQDDLFDIEAILPEGTTVSQVPAMVRQLLADRFGLRVSWQTKEVRGFFLEVAPGGPRLQRSPDEAPKRTLISTGRLVMNSVSIPELCDVLSGRFGRPVVDRTGLAGAFDFIIPSPGVLMPEGDRSESSEDLIWVLRGLGLKIQNTKLTVRYLTVEHALRNPTSN